MEEKTILIQDIPEAKVIVKDNLVFINTQEYIVEANYKNGLNEKALEDRYTQLLQKYDYIVGDWGHEQLRLKGFFSETNTSVEKDQRITSLEDYLREYCAFGCAYFVLKLNGKPIPFKPEPTKQPRRRQSKKYYDKSANKPDTSKFQSHKITQTNEKRFNKKKTNPKVAVSNEKVFHTEAPKTKATQNKKKHAFVIRTKGDR